MIECPKANHTFCAKKQLLDVQNQLLGAQNPQKLVWAVLATLKVGFVSQKPGFVPLKDSLAYKI